MIISSQIPWDQIKEDELENLVYWLLCEMGAKNLSWRKGGKGKGASDGGRDIECNFYTNINGNQVREHWWIEAKGSSGSVPTNKVKDVINNVTAYEHVHKLVIVTNSCFTNPTKDWVKKWQKSYPRTSIILWEKGDLERLCSENPSVVARIFPNALSIERKLDVAKYKFFEYCTYSDDPSLERFWEKKEILKFEKGSLFHLIASEFANGDISLRNWTIEFDADYLLNELQDTIINFSHYFTRADYLGINNSPLVKSIGYLILICIEKNGSDKIANLIKNEWNISGGGGVISEKNNEMTLAMVIEELIRVMRSNCRKNCQKMQSLTSERRNPEEVDWIGDESPTSIEHIRKSDARANLYAFDSEKLCDINQNKDCPLIIYSQQSVYYEKLVEIFRHIEQIRACGNTVHLNKTRHIFSLKERLNNALSSTVG